MSYKRFRNDEAIEARTTGFEKTSLQKVLLYLCSSPKKKKKKKNLCSVPSGKSIQLLCGYVFSLNLPFPAPPPPPPSSHPQMQLCGVGGG